MEFRQDQQYRLILEDTREILIEAPDSVRMLTSPTVTMRDRDSLQQWRVKVDDVVSEIMARIDGD